MSLDEALVSSLIDGCQIMGPGQTVVDLDSLLQSARLPRLLTQLRERSLAVVLETSGISKSAAAQTSSSLVDSVVVIAKRGTTKSADLAEAARLGRHMGAHTAGVVLVDAAEPILHPVMTARRWRRRRDVDTVGQGGNFAAQQPSPTLSNVSADSSPGTADGSGDEALAVSPTAAGQNGAADLRMGGVNR